jgi:hypothetical protein
VVCVCGGVYLQLRVHTGRVSYTVAATCLCVCVGGGVLLAAEGAYCNPFRRCCRIPSQGSSNGAVQGKGAQW